MNDEELQAPRVLTDSLSVPGTNLDQLLEIVFVLQADFAAAAVIAANDLEVDGAFRGCFFGFGIDVASIERGFVSAARKWRDGASGSYKVCARTRGKGLGPAHRSLVNPVVPHSRRAHRAGYLIPHKNSSRHLTCMHRRRSLVKQA